VHISLCDLNKRIKSVSARSNTGELLVEERVMLCRSNVADECGALALFVLNGTGKQQQQDMYTAVKASEENGSQIPQVFFCSLCVV
jgi:hypothetical protein